MVAKQDMQDVQDMGQTPNTLENIHGPPTPARYAISPDRHGWGPPTAVQVYESSIPRGGICLQHPSQWAPSPASLECPAFAAPQAPGAMLTTVKDHHTMAKMYDTAAIWSELLPLIASGASLPAALRQLPEPRPSLWWAKMAVRDDPDLAKQYRDAMELRADALADEIAALADEQIPSTLRGSDAAAWVQQQRLRVDAKKWLACKLFPRRWGDRMELSVDVAQRISITAALEAAQRRVDTIEAESLPASLLADSRTRA